MPARREKIELECPQCHNHEVAEAEKKEQYYPVVVTRDENGTAQVVDWGECWEADDGDFVNYFCRDCLHEDTELSTFDPQSPRHKALSAELSKES